MNANMELAILPSPYSPPPSPHPTHPTLPCPIMATSENNILVITYLILVFTLNTVCNLLKILGKTTWDSQSIN